MCTHTFDRFYVALGLPFKDDCRTIDYENFRSVVRYFLTDDFIDLGGSLIVNAEAGELFTLTREEKKRLTVIVAEEVNGRVPFFCGASNVDPCLLSGEVKDAMAEGAAGIFVMPPIGSIDITHAWNVRAFPEVYGNICRTIRDAIGDVPFICHGSGPRDPYYGVSFPIEVVDQLLDENPNIVGWKMMYNFGALKNVCLHLRRREADGKGHVGLLHASAHMFYENFYYGFLDGSVSCFWNYSKEKNIALISALRAGEHEQARQIWLDKGLFQLHNEVGNNRLHTNFKVAAWLKGLYDTPYVRAPMVNATRKEISNLRSAMLNAGETIISDDKIEEVCRKLSR